MPQRNKLFKTFFLQCDFTGKCYGGWEKFVVLTCSGQAILPICLWLCWYRLLTLSFSYLVLWYYSLKCLNNLLHWKLAYTKCQKKYGNKAQVSFSSFPAINVLLSTLPLGVHELIHLSWNADQRRRAWETVGFIRKKNTFRLASLTTRQK